MRNVRSSRWHWTQFTPVQPSFLPIHQEWPFQQIFLFSKNIVEITMSPNVSSSLYRTQMKFSYFFSLDFGLGFFLHWPFPDIWQPCQINDKEDFSRLSNSRGGGYLTNFNTGRLRPEVQPLTLLYTILAKKVPLLYTFYWRKEPLSHT